MGKPYSRTGDIIIATNPFQWFTHLYTDQKRSYYSNKLVWDNTKKDPREGMEQHVYEVSTLAYKGLAFGGEDQSILVSGESGAGKTETVEIAMNHMASVQEGPASEHSGGLDPVVQRVVDSNPLLESFGNAKTRRNDKSSRFGKYLQLQFNSSEAGLMAFGDKSESKFKLSGSTYDVYLLEKNRVVAHDTEEVTYHIFYQILATPDREKASYWDKLKGTNFDSFEYIGNTNTNTKKIAYLRYGKLTCNVQFPICSEHFFFRYLFYLPSFNFFPYVCISFTGSPLHLIPIVRSFAEPP